MRKIIQERYNQTKKLSSRSKHTLTKKHIVSKDLIGKALIVLMRVDLPEPEGPQITTTSPFLIDVVQSFKT